jgi:hypothetical protein
MIRVLGPAETAALIERFLNGKQLYPQEWNDFVEAVKVEPQVEPYRRKCYELDPLVNCPSCPDAEALEGLKKILTILRNM